MQLYTQKFPITTILNLLRLPLPWMYEYANTDVTVKQTNKK